MSILFSTFPNHIDVPNQGPVFKEMLHWVDENIFSGNFINCESPRSYYDRIYFRYEADLMAFKLRFGL